LKPIVIDQETREALLKADNADNGIKSVKKMERFQFILRYVPSREPEKNTERNRALLDNVVIEIHRWYIALDKVLGQQAAKINDEAPMKKPAELLYCCEKEENAIEYTPNEIGRIALDIHVLVIACDA